MGLAFDPLLQQLGHLSGVTHSSLTRERSFPPDCCACGGLRGFLLADPQRGAAPISRLSCFVGLQTSPDYCNFVVRAQHSKPLGCPVLP